MAPELGDSTCGVFTSVTQRRYPARAIIKTASVNAEPSRRGRTSLPVAIEDQHVALPKLYGAPAYARPPRAVEDSPRPFDPDDLPISAYQTDEERDMAEHLAGRPYAPGGGAYIESNGQAAKHPPARPLSLRAIAGRLLGG